MQRTFQVDLSPADEHGLKRKFNKINEYSKIPSFKKQPADMQNFLLQLNIADDYFKAKKQISLLEEEIQRKEKELYDLKHDLISYQIKMDSMGTGKRNKDIK